MMRFNAWIFGHPIEFICNARPEEFPDFITSNENYYLIRLISPTYFKVMVQ